MLNPGLARSLTRAGLLFLVGCASSAPPDVGPPPDLEDIEYRIGPGDNLQIFVWEHKDLSVTVPVRPDGKISTPLVDDLVAVGKTPSELARDMETALGEYVRSPTVSIIVTGFQGEAGQQIKVVGQALNPRAISYRSQMTLLDVMIEVGGLTEYAAGNRARVIRRSQNGQNTEIRVRLHDLINGGDMSQNIMMLPGDVLIIPESRF